MTVTAGKFDFDFACALAVSQDYRIYVHVDADDTGTCTPNGDDELFYDEVSGGYALAIDLDWPTSLAAHDTCEMYNPVE